MAEVTRVVAALEAWGAAAVPHPGGTLLDHLVRNEAFAREHGPGIAALFQRCRDHVSHSAWMSFEDLLGEGAQPSPRSGGATPRS